MESIELFFGLPLSESFADKFQKLNPEIRSMFIQDKPNYLQKIVVGEHSFIGKNIGKIADIDSLQLMHTHIISILKKLIPDYNYDSNSLVLFPFVIHD